MARRKRLGFNLGSRRCGAAAFAASFGRKSYGAATAALGGPVTGGYGPRRIRCRVRQHHGQGDETAPDVPDVP